jgi:hypothetical protein
MKGLLISRKSSHVLYYETVNPLVTCQSGPLTERFTVSSSPGTVPFKISMYGDPLILPGNLNLSLIRLKLT